MASSISNGNGHTNGSDSGPLKKQRQVRNITTFFEIKSSWKYNHYCPTCDYKIATYIPRAGRMDKCILFLLYSFIVAMIVLLVIYA